MSSSREAQRLADIVANGEAAIDYVGTLPVAAFAADRKTVDATERCLERLIEAAIKVGETRMGQIAPSLRLHELRGMGNALRHAYDAIDPRIVHATVIHRLPEIVADCRAALDIGQQP